MGVGTALRARVVWLLFSCNGCSRRVFHTLYGEFALECLVYNCMLLLKCLFVIIYLVKSTKWDMTQQHNKRPPKNMLKMHKMCLFYRFCTHSITFSIGTPIFF